LIEQKKELAEVAKAEGLKAIVEDPDTPQDENPKTDEQTVRIRHLAYDFTRMDEEKDKFYASLDKECQRFDRDGGVGEFYFEISHEECSRYRY
jgi:hypothetical protein